MMNITNDFCIFIEDKVDMIFVCECPSISEMTFMILKSNSNKIRGLRQAAIEDGIKFFDFTNTMTIGTYIEQIEKTKQTKEEELVYYGIVLFGDWNKVSDLTRKFSLWK